MSWSFVQLFGYIVCGLKITQTFSYSDVYIVHPVLGYIIDSNLLATDIFHTERLLSFFWFENRQFFPHERINGNWSAVSSPLNQHSPSCFF